MKKTHLKRILAMLTAMSVCLAGPGSVSAETAEFELSDMTGKTAVLQQAEIGIPLTDVTEEEARAFEHGLESGLSAVTGTGSDLSQQAQKKAKALVSLYGANSIQYAVMQKGELILSDAYGIDDAKKKTQVTTDSIYGIASISKIFTTTAVMQLVEDGKLDLDTPVVHYIPEFKMKDARYKDITVRMLLNHSSGLMGGGLGNAILYEDPDSYYHDHFLEKLKNERLKADPGTYSVYCNDGFQLAELVVERVSGETFSDYLKKSIFTPLGLSHTRTPLQLAKTDAVAGAYLTKGGEKQPTECFNSIATGGIYSSAEDLCRFGMVYTKDNGNLLQADSVAATFVQEGRKGLWCEEYSGIIDYGLGWDSVDTYPFKDYGITAVEKGGDSLLYHGQLMVFPEYDLSVAVLSSGGASSYDAIFAQYLAKELMKEQGIISKDRIASVPTKYAVHRQTVPAELKNIGGYYLTMSANYKITVTSDGLQFVNLASPKQKITFIYSGDGLFILANGSQALKFVTQNGTNYMMAGIYSTLPGIGTSYGYLYAAQKVAEKQLSSSVKKAWQERDGKKYFLVSEKYSSVLYAMSAVVTEANMKQSCKGYFYNTKIVDANAAKAFTALPMQGSRDATDYIFEKDASGREYLQGGGMRAIREDALKNLSEKSSFAVTISKKNGEAKWYKVGEKTAGKKMLVTLPKNQGAMVSVYDSDGKLKLNTYISGNRSIKLPQKGFVVFAGDKGATIKVKIK